MTKRGQKPKESEHAVYRLLIAPDLASLRRVWESLPPATQRELVPLKNLLKDKLK